ncbi:hypothetical protein FOL47_001585 [Perkinsus chesapeaki]|uniref:Uncharacterized protein n=1 Tax=Perkinsus chesapeaki TaxID=330153 RepID=A0A7J6MJU1_PERCH|nr:hypothetical protein FOL47_001585 [Perkinsus chesapeaki]
MAPTDNQSVTTTTQSTAPPITISSRPWVSHGHNRFWVSKYGGVSKRPQKDTEDPLIKEWVVHQTGQYDPQVSTADWQVVDPPSVDITYKSVLLECKPTVQGSPKKTRTGQSSS